MFWNNEKSNGTGSGTVTIIGPGVCIKGNVTFSGYLRVQGEIVGNVTCNNDAQGTIVIHGPGSVTGAIHAPNIVVGGKIHGPLHATESIDIHENASVVGDVRYKRLSIQVGGSVDGGLFPTMAPATEIADQERRIAVPEAPLIKALDGPHAHERRVTDRFWTKRNIAIAAALLLGVVMFFWPKRLPTDVQPPQLAVTPTMELPTRTAPEAPLPSTRVPEPTTVVPRASEVVPAVPTATTPATPAGDANSSTDRVLSVEGMEADKPAGFFFLTTREPVVFYQKTRGNPGEGKRIEVGRGAKKRLAISDQEVIRIAKGDNLDLYYQGRKVSPRIIQSGAWIDFIPTPQNNAAQ